MNKIQFILFLFFSFSLQAQTEIDMKGLWQGMMILDGSKGESIVYIHITSSGKILDGKIREEYSNSEYYAIKKITGQSSNNQLSFKETLIEKKKSKSALNWYKFEGTLTYNDSTGYLEGRVASKESRKSGKMILYRSTASFSDNDKTILAQSWITDFKEDLKLGLNAPEIRIKEMKEFVFEPIYFDVDKAEIKPEYNTFLLKMIRVINGHSDLRVQVTGHTDSDGSDAYNEDLSKRRSQAIVDYFVKNGIEAGRLTIEFKGEKNPVDTNNTPEGKKHNRRVDFEFVYK